MSKSIKKLTNFLNHIDNNYFYKVENKSTNWLKIKVL